MIYCKVEKGVVVNRAVFDGDMPAEWARGHTWLASEQAQIGWSFNGVEFVAPAPVVMPPLVTETRTDEEKLAALFRSVGLTADRGKELLATRAVAAVK